MRDRDIIAKLELLTSTMDKEQLQTLLAQVKNKDYTQLVSWFEGQNNPLTQYELDTLSGLHHPAYIGVYVVSELIGKWRRERRLKFIADYAKDDLKPIRATVIDRLALQGETEFYAKDVFLEAMKSLVKELQVIYNADLIVEQARLEVLRNG